MEAFLAVGGGSGEDGSSSDFRKNNNNVRTGKSPSPSSSFLSPFTSARGAGSLLDNGMYWKYLVGDKGNDDPTPPPQPTPPPEELPSPKVGPDVPKAAPLPRGSPPSSETDPGVERFDGKIVYNPDGSAYIIEDSELSEEDCSLDHLEGCIVDGRGVNLNSIGSAIPQIAKAFYVSHNPLLNYYGGDTYGSVDSKSKVPEIPIMHSYRVYTVRDNERSKQVNGEKKENESDFSSSVPIKPILMCFMCKLSFGYTKSFVAHAMGDHSLNLSEEEKNLLAQRNVSAIIQAVGKSKDPLVSFLEPITTPSAAAPPPPHVPAQSVSKVPKTTPLSEPLEVNRKSPEVGQSALSRPSPMGMDLTRKSPGSGRSSVSPGNSVSPTPINNQTYPMTPISSSSQGPPNFMTGTTIGVCPEHMNGRPSGVDCGKCELILNSSRMGALGSLHTRNSCKTLKCPKCNWHYKYQETLEIHMKEKHPDNETSCIYCIAGQPHPRLARGETYTCGYKPYRCEVCNYSTTTKGNLSIHMQSDKHLNNMQELQNGGVPPPESVIVSVPPPAPSQSKSSIPSPSNSNGVGNSNGPPSIPQSPKPKPTFRCDVCNYETNVARNLRIHMTSEKHTHNMMVLQQNVKHMQHLSALQQAQAPFDPAALLGFHPGLGGDKGGEAALADMAYNQALLIQMMTGGQIPPHIPPELAPHMDLGLNPDTMEPPPEPPDPNPTNLFTCCVCTTYNTDSLESLSHHLSLDRTKLRESEILVLVAGNYMCKLCSYKTNLKANFQLHCKTDKHLQRLQHVNHIKEGGLRNEWKLKYLSMSNPIQVRCNACDYYTNSAHKLQLHSAHQRHEISVLIFRHLGASESHFHEDGRIYVCALCGFQSRVKLQLLQHTRSLKHLQLEQLHSLQRRAEGKDGIPDLGQIFRVLEQPESSDSPGPTNSHHHSLSDYFNDADKELLKKDGVLKQALEKDSEFPDLSCPFCSFVTDSESRLSSHLATAHSSSNESSGSRNSEFPRISSSPENNNSVSCPLCSESCADRTKLESHVMLVHSVNAESLQRLLMLVNQSGWLNSSSSSTENNLDNEKDPESEDSHSELIGDELRCTNCNRQFRSLDELCNHCTESGHWETKSTPNGPVYLCWRKGCNQYFPNIQNLQIHYREIHLRRRSNSNSAPVTISEKHIHKFRCNQCSLAFKTMEKLQIHAQYHTIREASKCDFCGRCFRTVHALQKHVETSHAGNLSEEELSIYKQKCASNPLFLAGGPGILDLGLNELLRKETARENEEMIGGNDSEDESNSSGEKDQNQLFEDYLNTQAMAEDSYNDMSRKYKCHRCKVAFTRQSYLTSHNKTLLHRKGEKLSYPMEKYMDPNRPFKCEVCKESFTQKNILLVHYNSVSHLHKLKRAMQEQSALLSSMGTPMTNSNASNLTPPANSSPLLSPSSAKESKFSSPEVKSSTGSHSTEPKSSPEEEDKKPFKCNICKVAYSQGSTLDIHMRSVLHQTRASKLQELVLSGQVDPLKPLIEQPEVNPRTKLNNSPKITETSTPSSPISTSTVASSVSPAQNLACARCGSNCPTPEALMQHQQLCFLASLFPVNSEGEGGNEEMESFGTTRFVMPSRKSSQLYKHILESYGFEIVMQFNEYHQKRSREMSNQSNDVEEPMDVDEGILREFPELAKSTCPYCKKVFSSVWILKAHTEEIHRDVISMESLESFAEDFRSAYMRKLESSNNGNENEEEAQQPVAAASPPTASITPASSSESAPVKTESNLSMSLAQHMNEVQAALASMAAASQLGHFGHMMNMNMNPMMMASLGMAGLPLGLNMNALAAMNLQPPLVPLMMPPPYEAPPSIPSPAHFEREKMNTPQPGPPPPPPSSQNSTQKRARTRITDDQLKILRAHFDINNSPSEEQISQMAAQSGLPPKVIKHWFRNTLFKERQRNKDSPYNFSNPPSTTLNLEEYEKTGEAQVKNIAPEDQKAYEPPVGIKKETKPKQSAQNSPGSGTSAQGVSNSSITSSTPTPPAIQIPTVPQARSMDQSNVSAAHGSQNSQNNQREQNLLNSQSAAQNLNLAAQSILNNQSAAQSLLNSQSAAQSLLHSQSSAQSSLGSNAAMQNAIQQHQLLAALHQHHQEQLQAYSNHPDLQEMLCEYSENEEEPQPPVKPKKKSEKKVPKVEESLNLSLGAQHEGQSSLSSSPSPSQMLPPPKGFPSSGSNLLSSPINLNSPGSSCGRGENPSMTTPPLSNCPSQSSISSGKRANRTRFTDYQIKVLQEFFENNAYPKDDDLEYLSKLLGLSPRVIVVWFQNARQKARKVYENQPPVESPAEEGAGRFQRTPGLNYQCKKCLLVFQRYYELIRHQKTHCFKEEDAKRSAQAQAAAAQVAAAMSSEDSNSSAITDNNSLTSSCGPSPGGMMNNSNNNAVNMMYGSSENLKIEQQESFQCEKCNLVFTRFELWREHQLVHLMNPNLFSSSYTNESPFGILQSQALGTNSSNTQNITPNTNVTVKIEPGMNSAPMKSPSESSSNAGDATGKRKWSADEVTEDDEGAEGQPRDKRLRTTILPEQLDYLYQKYQIESNPSRKMLETIAREVGLKKRVVQVWFQNTRARERKGQFRAHAQVINKRCPFCPALFKVKSALETHLAGKHSDQVAKGDINIDALPDEEYDGPPSPLNSSDTPKSTYGVSSPSNIIMPSFLHSLSTHAELESSLTKLYEESLKRYAVQVQQGNLNGRSTEGHAQKESGGTGEFPLDLSKPVDLSRANDLMENDYASDTASHDSNPHSPASSTASSNKKVKGEGSGSQSKRYRTQMSSLQVKVMKSLFFDYKTPTMAECEMLGEEIGLPKRVIQVWFQNARAKEKKSKSITEGVVTQSSSNLNLSQFCTHCKFPYSHKYSIQDHIFTKSHIDTVKANLLSTGKINLGKKKKMKINLPPPEPGPESRSPALPLNSISSEMDYVVQKIVSLASAENNTSRLGSP